jgi:hypothetical protein
MVNILIWPLPGGSFRAVLAFASEAEQTAAQTVRGALRGAAGPIKALFGKRKRQLRSLSERLSAVSTLTARPAKFVGYQNELASFSAVPSDSSGETVQGAKLTWSVSDSSIMRISETGGAKLLQPGMAWVTCEAGSARCRIPVYVRSGSRPPQTKEEWIRDQDYLKADGTLNEGLKAGLAALADNLAPSVSAQGSGYSLDYVWDYEPNLVGSPPNHGIVPTRFGSVMPESSNFSFSVPAISLAGRGLNVDMSLYYNSRVWMQNGDTLEYEPLPSFPTTGFIWDLGT